jgi:hypothetical protein
VVRQARQSKDFLLLTALLMYMQVLRAQPSPADYIRLDMRYYTENGERYLGTSPELITTRGDAISQAMVKYPRRFRYLLLNRSAFQGIYEGLYPDTVRINHLYTASLQKDPEFVRAFQLLCAPFSGKTTDTVRFTRSELLQVAARFFYCEAVTTGLQIRSSICIGRNGLSSLLVTDDQAVLEAFCFEAIFETYYPQPGQKNVFVNNFLSYIENVQ